MPLRPWAGSAILLQRSCWLSCVERNTKEHNTALRGSHLPISGLKPVQNRCKSGTSGWSQTPCLMGTKPKWTPDRTQIRHLNPKFGSFGCSGSSDPGFRPGPGSWVGPWKWGGLTPKSIGSAIKPRIWCAPDWVFGRCRILDLSSLDSYGECLR